MSTGQSKHRGRYVVAAVLVLLLVSVSAVSLAGASAPTAPANETGSPAATAPADLGGPETVATAEPKRVPGATTNATTANTSAGVADTETYLLVLSDNLTSSPIQTATDVNRAQRRAERAQAPVVDRLEAKDIPVTAQFWITNAVMTTVDPDTVTPADLRAIDGVARVEPNVEFHRPDPRPGTENGLTSKTTATTTEIGATTYGLKQINIDGFVDAYQTNGSGTRVAILDDGLNESHPDINVTLGVNVADGTVSNPATTTLQQGNGHGDHVAGTATGTTTPAGEVPRYSVAPDAALLKADVFVGGATLTDIIAAIEWAVEEDADVVSMSLGISDSDTDSTIVRVMEETIQNANTAGTVVIGSAGNDGSGSTGGPVSSPGTEFSSTAVGATDSTGDVGSFSSGAVISPDTSVMLEDGATYPEHYPHTYVKPDVTAPGVNVVSAGPLNAPFQEGPAYSTASGTSMAAPHVAGAVALLQSATTTQREPDVLINALAETARTPDGTRATSRDIRYGMGIIDVLAARNALNTTTPIDGTVTGNGNTLTGAAITTDSGVISATDGGTYAIESTTDATTVAVTANEYGYVPGTTSVATGGSETLDFELDKIEALRVEREATPIETTSTTNLTVIADHPDGTKSAITQVATVASSDPSVATVNGTTISGHSAGTTTITAQYDGFAAETTLEVRERERIELSVNGQQAAVSIEPQETSEYTVEAIFDDGSTKSITDNATLGFAPNQNEAAVSIDTDAARITGTEPAENVTLVADDGTFEDTINITVTDSKLETIGLDLSNTTVTTGNSITATVTGTYSDGSEQTITDNATITAGDTAIAAVENTTITGISSGTTTITATVNNETATADLTVRDPAFFDVNVTHSPSAVVEGEALTVEYTVSNTGERTGTQTITVSVNETAHTSEERQLEANETITDTVTYQTQSGDAPSLGVDIASANDSITETVSVQTQPQFAVAIESLNESVVEGDTITTAYTVTNTGDVAGTQNITLTVNDTIEATVPNVTLDGHTNRTATITYQTQSGDAPAVKISIASTDTTATEEVAVKRPPRFGVAIESITESVSEGDTISVAYTVTNTGDLTGTQSVSLRANGTVQNTTTTTLASGATANSTLQYQTQPGDAPALNISITTAETIATETVAVEAPSTVTATIDETASTISVTEPDPIVIAAEIRNRGTQTRTAPITYALTRNNNTTATNTTNVTVLGETTTTVNFTTATSDLDGGEYLATVDSETNSDTQSITVEQARTVGGDSGGGGGQQSLRTENRDNFTIRNSSQSATELQQGESFSVSADIQNTGEQGAQQIQLLVEGTQTDTKAVLLRPRETKTITFENIEVAGPAGEYTYRVVTEDDTVNGTITVRGDTETGTATPKRTAEHNNTTTSTGAENSTSVATTADDAAPDTGSTSTESSIPGFGMSVAVLSLLLGISLLRIRS